MRITKKKKAQKKKASSPMMRYFTAPRGELSGENGTCRFCGRDTFLLTTGRPAKPIGTGTQLGGCLECLRNGLFTVDHETEAGRVTSKAAPRKLGPQAAAELRRTPEFRSWQNPTWLVHCGDAMTYIGVWQGKDVERAART